MNLNQLLDRKFRPSHGAYPRTGRLVGRTSKSVRALSAMAKLRKTLNKGTERTWKSVPHTGHTPGPRRSHEGDIGYQA